MDAADRAARAQGPRGAARARRARTASSTAPTATARPGSRRAEREAEELGYTRQPYVVIVGGGQGGIALGARLRQLGVPTIIVERNERPGDSWRKRYKSLCLHDPVWYDHLPYIKFPENWPVFSPKDKIGDWLEMYTRVMELNYWGSTDGQERALRRGGAASGSLVVERDGADVTLRPKQLVLATGMSSKPNMPEIPGMDVFKGDQHHSSQHPGPDAYRGKKAVVIGSNNSAHDICAALWEARRRRDDGAALLDAHRALGHADGHRARRALLRAGGRVRDHHGEGGHDLRLAAVPDPARVPDPALRPDARARQGLLRAAGGRGLPARLGRGRLRPVHEVPAPRLGLLHRRRRLRAGRRAATIKLQPGTVDQAHRARRRDGGRHRAAGRPRRRTRRATAR